MSASSKDLRPGIVRAIPGRTWPEGAEGDLVGRHQRIEVSWGTKPPGFSSSGQQPRGENSFVIHHHPLRHRRTHCV